ncbi:MAG: MBG domain-containing protein, partial [bacterium]
RAAGQSVAGSPYAITQGTLSAGSNYTLTFTPSTLSITPYALSVTANPQTRVYGAADPTLTYSFGTLWYSDTPATVFSGELTRAAGDTVAGSPYAITQGTLTSNSNYTISFTPSTLSITPADLVIRAQDQTRGLGDPNPPFTFTFTTLLLGDTPASITGLSATTTANTDS